MRQNASFLDTQITRRRAVQIAGAIPLLASSLLVSCGIQPQPTTSSVPAALAPGGALDQYVKQLADQDKFSGTLLVAKGDKPALLRAYGMANKAQHIANTAQTIYATASITKSFTATAITQLAQQQKLSFTDHLGKYLDGFPSSIANSVTIDQLLTHTSGMGDFIQSPNFSKTSATWKSGTELMNGALSVIRKQALQFTPGTHFFYSNSGYLVLGAIIADVSGMDYYDYIQQHIFAAANMTSSRFYTRPEQGQNKAIAHPYSSGSNPMRPTSGPLTDVSGSQGFIGNPSGDAYSTVEDMLRYCQALQTHRLLNPSFTNLLMTGKISPGALAQNGPSKQPAKAPSKDRSIKYAYGLTDTLFKGKRIVWHNGGSPGAATIFEMFPALGWSLVILSNYGPGDSFMALVDKAEELITS